MIRLSTVIPCYNEAGSIGSVLDGVKRSVPDAEIIVVDDGSVDGTGEVVSRVPGVQVLRLEKNEGKGAALRKGMEAARGDILVFLDGDGQYDPADMLPLLAAIEDGYPFVIGSKFMGTFEQGSISRSNIWGNRFMTALINLLFKASVTDSQSGFRAISRELVKGLQLRSMQYEIETEMLCRALKAGIKVKEVPVTGKARIAGATNFRRLRNGGRVLRTILTERVTA